MLAFKFSWILYESDFPLWLTIFLLTFKKTNLGNVADLIFSLDLRPQASLCGPYMTLMSVFIKENGQIYDYFGPK